MFIDKFNGKASSSLQDFFLNHRWYKKRRGVVAEDKKKGNHRWYKKKRCCGGRLRVASDGRTDGRVDRAIPFHFIPTGPSYVYGALCGIKGVHFYCHLCHCPLQIISKLSCGNLRHRTSWGIYATTQRHITITSLASHLRSAIIFC